MTAFISMILIFVFMIYLFIDELRHEKRETKNDKN